MGVAYDLGQRAVYMTALRIDYTDLLGADET